MKRNFDMKPLDLRGEPMKSGNDRIKRDAQGRPVFDPETSDVIVIEKAKDATFSSVLVDVVMAETEEDSKADGKTKLGRFTLGGKIVKGGWVDITTEDADLLRKRSEKLLPALTYARVCEFLDTDPEQE